MYAGADAVNHDWVVGLTPRVAYSLAPMYAQRKEKHEPVCEYPFTEYLIYGHDRVGVWMQDLNAEYGCRIWMQIVSCLREFVLRTTVIMTPGAWTGDAERQSVDRIRGIRGIPG